jgi:hypothetical protein
MMMRKLLTTLLLVGTLLAPSQAAQAAPGWHTIKSDEGFGVASASVYNRWNVAVRFYAGHADVGKAGPFRVIYLVRCQNTGVKYFEDKVVRDTPQYLWASRVLYLNQGDGNCTYRVAARTANQSVRMEVRIEVRN